MNGSPFSLKIFAWWAEADRSTPASYENFLKSVHPDDMERVVSAVQKAMFQGQSYKIEHRIIRPDGDVRTLIAQGEVHFSSSGQPLTMFGISQDVTDIIRLRKDSEEHRHRLRAVLDKAA